MTSINKRIAVLFSAVWALLAIALSSLMNEELRYIVAYCTLGLLPIPLFWGAWLSVHALNQKKSDSNQPESKKLSLLDSDLKALLLAILIILTMVTACEYSRYKKEQKYNSMPYYNYIEPMSPPTEQSWSDQVTPDTATPAAPMYSNQTSSELPSSKPSPNTLH